MIFWFRFKSNIDEKVNQISSEKTTAEEVEVDEEQEEDRGDGGGGRGGGEAPLGPAKSWISIQSEHQYEQPK